MFYKQWNKYVFDRNSRIVSMWNCMCRAVNVYIIVNQWDATFILSDIKALEYDKLVIMTS